VEVGRDSNVLTLSAEADDAGDAARLSNTATEVFLEGCRGVERARAEERLRALGEEAGRVREQLAVIREQYDRFRAEHGIADLALDREAAIVEAAQLRTEANRSRIEAESNDAKATLLRLATGHEPPRVVLSETETRASDRKLAELRAELTARSASLSGEHPEVLGISAAVRALEGRPPEAAALGDRVLGTNPQWTFLQQSLMGANAEKEAAKQKWTAYAALEASARDRIRRLSAVEGQAALMLAELHVVEGRLGELAAQQKVAESDARQPPAGFRVLTAATPPQLPSRSHRRMVAAGLPVLLGLLATVACAGPALRGLKLWTPSEITFWGRGPVVAASTWPAGAEGPEELVLDLKAALARARGVTLMLALSPRRAREVAELASRLERAGPTAAPGEGPEPRGALAVWSEPDRVQALRRAARQSARVLVFVEAGEHSVFELRALRPRLGREDQVGFVVLGLGTDFARLADQVGAVTGFWRDPEGPRNAARPPQPMER
jgi:hypothetical protein